MINRMNRVGSRVEEDTSILASAVRYDADQIRSDEEKAQARANMGAISAAQLADTKADLEEQIENISGISDPEAVSQMVEDVAKHEEDISALKSNFTPGTNLFNKNDTENIFNGIYVDATNGAKKPSTTVSVYIAPIDHNEGTLSFNIPWCHIVFTTGYVDLSNVEDYTIVNGFISGIAGGREALTGVSIPSTANYVIVSFATNRIADAQLQYGSKVTAYESYCLLVNGQKIKKESIPIDAIKTSTYLTIGTNLFNKDDAKNIFDGIYVYATNGTKREASTLSAYITPIDHNEETLSFNIPWCHIVFITGYVDLSNVEMGAVVNGFISGVTGGSGALTGVSIPDTANYVIVSFATNRIADAQLQYGTSVTSYESYGLYINGQQIKKFSIPDDALERSTYTVDINGNGDFTSLLSALKNTPDNTRIIVRKGTYNIISEYESFYGSDFWTNYDSYNNHYDDPFYRGYWITDGRTIDCESGAVFTFNYDGTNANVQTYFAPFSLGKDATIKGVTVLFSVNCRYAVHDDFAGTPGGTNIIENCVFDGPRTAIGGGCGQSNTYLINNCIFLNGTTGTNVFYHNNVNAGAKNKIFVSNCYGNSGLEFKWFGASTEMTECLASSCTFDHISVLANSSGVTENENMRLYKNNCTETGT